MERKDLLPTSEEMGYDKDCTCSPDEDNILERLREQLGYDNISEMISKDLLIKVKSQNKKIR